MQAPMTMEQLAPGWPHKRETGVVLQLTVGCQSGTKHMYLSKDPSHCPWLIRWRFHNPKSLDAYCILTWGTFLPNVTQIWFETTKPYIFLEAVTATRSTRTRGVQWYGISIWFKNSPSHHYKAEYRVIKDSRGESVTSSSSAPSPSSSSAPSSSSSPTTSIPTVSYASQTSARHQCIGTNF